MSDLQLYFYKYFEETNQFKALKRDGGSYYYTEELMIITAYLKKNSIKYLVDENQSIQIL